MSLMTLQPLTHPKKTMGICTFCLHRLEEGLLPACVSLCPTSALQLYDYQDDSLKTTTPRKQMVMDLEKRLNHRGTK